MNCINSLMICLKYMSISEDNPQAVFINSIPNFFVLVSNSIKIFFVNPFKYFFKENYL